MASMKRLALAKTTPERKVPQGHSSTSQTNKERMRYAKFRQQGLFVGSGVVKLAADCCRATTEAVGNAWTVNHANAIIALRCCQLAVAGRNSGSNAPSGDIWPVSTYEFDAHLFFVQATLERRIEHLQLLLGD